MMSNTSVDDDENPHNISGSPASSPGEDDIIILENIDEELKFCQLEADRFNDSDIEYIGEKKSKMTTTVDDFVFINTELIKKEKTDIENSQLEDKKGTVIDIISKDFANKLDTQSQELKEVKEQLKILMTSFQENKTEKRNLMDMSLEIDKTPVSTQIMPSEIYIDSDLEDEVDLAEVTHSTPKNKKDKRNDQIKLKNKTNLNDTIKAKVASDTFYSPSQTKEENSSEPESLSPKSQPKSDKKKDRIFRNQTPETRENLEIYSKEKMTKISPNDSVKGKRKHDFENDEEEMNLKKTQSRKCNSQIFWRCKQCRWFKNEYFE